MSAGLATLYRLRNLRILSDAEFANLKEHEDVGSAEQLRICCGYQRLTKMPLATNTGIDSSVSLSKLLGALRSAAPSWASSPT